jgi:Eukaryotic-type carbonic anhydrase
MMTRMSILNEMCQIFHCQSVDSYAGEMHLVHFNAKYGTYENALNHSDGLAVLGVFLEVIDPPLLPPFALIALPPPRVPYFFLQPVPIQWPRFVYFKPMNVDNRGLRPILMHLGEVTHKSDWVHIPETVDFHELLPASTRKFYRYHGSLTTPPCSEIVTWTLFQDPITISSQQVVIPSTDQVNGCH